MNWWIGFCWIAGSICFAMLDHRARKLAGKRWLSEWPWRLVTYFALGGVFAAIGYAPFFLYQLSEAIVGIYNHPPTLSMLAVLLVFAVASIIAVEILKLACRTIREISSSQHDIKSMAVVRRIAGALVLFTVAVGGFLFGFHVLRSH